MKPSKIEFKITKWDEPIPEELQVVHYDFTCGDLEVYIDGICIHDYELHTENNYTTHSSHHVCVWYLLNNIIDRLWYMLATKDYEKTEDLRDYGFFTTLFCGGFNFPHLKITENDGDTLKVHYNLKKWSKSNYSTNNFKRVKYHDTGFGNGDVTHVVSKLSYVETVVNLLIETATRAKNLCHEYRDELYAKFNHHNMDSIFTEDYEKWHSYFAKELGITIPSWEELK